jgi:Holliday junction resolvasome RuvABC endonuclease subunit
MDTRLIGIDPGLVRTGIALGKSDHGKLIVLKHSTFGAEGDNWLEKCEDVATRVKNWILNNTSKFTHLQVFIEEPIQFYGKTWGANTAAVQNRAFHAIISELSDLSSESRPTHIHTIQPMTMKRLFAKNGHAKKDLIVKRAKKLYAFRDNWSKQNTEATADAIGLLYCAYIFNAHYVGTTQKGIVELK